MGQPTYRLSHAIALQGPCTEGPPDLPGLNGRVQLSVLFCLPTVVPGGPRRTPIRLRARVPARRPACPGPPAAPRPAPPHHPNHSPVVQFPPAPRPPLLPYL